MNNIKGLATLALLALAACGGAVETPAEATGAEESLAPDAGACTAARPGGAPGSACLRVAAPAGARCISPAGSSCGLDMAAECSGDALGAPPPYCNAVSATHLGATTWLFCCAP